MVFAKNRFTMVPKRKKNGASEITQDALNNESHLLKSYNIEPLLADLLYLSTNTVKLQAGARLG